MNLVQILYRNEKKFGLKTAFIEKGERISYAMLLRQVQGVAASLVKLGVQRGDEVVLLQPVSAQLYIVMIALWSIGAAAVIFDPSAGAAQIEKCLARVDARLIIGCHAAMALRLVVKPLRKILQHVEITSLFHPGTGRQEEPIPCDAQTPALITFTSGSTGFPKVAVRTHGFLYCQYQSVERNMDYRAEDIDLAVLPVFTLVNLVRGITTVIPDDRLRDIEHVVFLRLARQILEYGVTRITGSPAFIGGLADRFLQKGLQVPMLRRINVGGGPVFPWMLQKISAAFPEAELFLVYGSTEAEPIAKIGFLELRQEHFFRMEAGEGLIGGRVVSDIQLRILENCALSEGASVSTAAFEAATSSPHEPGEIVVSGAHVLSGYKDGVGDQENKLLVGDEVWHRTGDLGRLDEDGILWLLGRKSAVQIDYRGVLYPFSVECALCSRHGISRAALLVTQEERVVVIEGTKAQQEAIQRENLFLLDRVVCVKRIPTDSRHRSKIDYIQLNRLVKETKKK